MSAPGEERWRFELDASPYAAPSVVDETVYITGGSLWAIDATTGEERWRFESVDGSAAPLVVRGTVYVSDGDLYAVDATTGAERWRFKSDGTSPCSPAVADGTVYFGTDEADDGGRVYAVDAITGEERWQFERALKSRVGVTVRGRTVYFQSSDGHLYAVEATTGEEQWRFECGTAWSSPTIADDTVYAGGRGRLHAVDATTGEERWHFDAESETEVFSSPTVVGDTVYFANERLYAIDTTTGEARWSMVSERHFRGSSPTVADETVYIGGGLDQYLYAIDAETGAERWRADCGVIEYSDPVVVNGTVYVGGGSYVRAIDADGAGSSIDSRVALGTLGQYDARITSDPAEVVPAGKRTTVSVPNGAEAALRAEAARTEGAFSEAIARYERAIDAYREARDDRSAPTDQRERFEETVRRIRRKRRDARALKEHRSALRETLAAAESSFQTAIAAHADGNVTFPRIRYRQARNAYDTALELVEDAGTELLAAPLTVSVDIDGSPPPDDVRRLSGVADETVAALLERGIETLDDVTDEGVGETDLSADEANRVRALSRWHGADEYTFRERTAIERRRENAADGLSAL